MVSSKSSRNNAERKPLSVGLDHSGLTHSAEAIYSALREAIVSNEVGTGAFLREEVLAREFGVSRTPIREVLVRLEAEQLVTRVPRRGLVVRSIDSQEMNEIYMIRMLVDGLAARLAATKQTPVDVARLRWLNSQMRNVAERGDIDAVAERNMEFHEVLCQIAGNRMLAMFMAQVHGWVRRSELNPFAYPNRGQEGADEHDVIIDAIAAGDGARAEALIRNHMQKSHDIRAHLLAVRAAKHTVPGKGRASTSQTRQIPRVRDTRSKRPI